MEEQWTLGDTLSSVSADLLSYKRFEPFLDCLFATPSGSWHAVADCCSGLSQLPEFAEELFDQHGTAFQVTHLPWPEPGCGAYALILFVHTGELWSNIAAYNRGRLERDRG